jgi:DNA-binding response OmpR family regulator
MDFWSLDPNHESGYLSIRGAAIGDALSHDPAQDAPATTAPARERRADTQIGQPRPARSTPSLTADEEALLRIFIARRSQCLTQSALERMLSDARQARKSAIDDATPPTLESVIASLSAKLSESDLRWRIVAMEGCGYILWH